MSTGYLAKQDEMQAAIKAAIKAAAGTSGSGYIVRLNRPGSPEMALDRCENECVTFT